MGNQDSKAEKADKAETSENSERKQDESAEHLSRFANSLPADQSINQVALPGLPQLDLIKSSNLDRQSGATRTLYANGTELTEYQGGGRTTRSTDENGISTYVIESTGRPARIAQFDKEGSVISYSDGEGNIYTSEMRADENDPTRQHKVWTITTKEGEQRLFDGTVSGDNTGNIVVRDNSKSETGSYAERRLNNGTVIRSDKDNLERTIETTSGLTIQNKSYHQKETIWTESGPVEVVDPALTLQTKTLTYPENKGTLVLQYNADGSIASATRTTDGAIETLQGSVKESNGQVEIANADGIFVIGTNGEMNKVDPYEYQGIQEDAPPDPEATPVIQEVPACADLDANIAEAEQMRNGRGYMDPTTQEVAKYVWFYNKVKPGAEWDYKVKGMQYEDFGNFNYGATAAAAGIPLEVALKEAGRFQTAQKKEWGKPGYYISEGTGSNGDDPRDQLKIREGYEHYLKLKAQREQQTQQAA